MHDQRRPDRVILALLTDSGAQRPWSVDEMEREIAQDVTDSLARLYGGGLIHRLDRFIWATRAATCMDDLLGSPV
jgi:hypothetical protein